MLFSDRLEVWNPGRLPPQLTLEKLRLPHGSVPGNRLIAQALYLAKYIEQSGTGTLDMIRRCATAGLPEPEFTVTDGFVATIRRAAPQSETVSASGPSDLANKEIAMLRACARTDATAAELRAAAGYASRTRAFRQRLDGLLVDGLLRMTLANKPSSSRQRYRITPKGTAQLERSGVQVESRWGPSVVQVAGHSWPQASVPARLDAKDTAMLEACAKGSVSNAELRIAAGYASRTGTFRQRLDRLLQNALLELTIPDRPRSRSQRYRLTAKGRAALILSAEAETR